MPTYASLVLEFLQESDSPTIFLVFTNTYKPTATKRRQKNQFVVFAIHAQQINSQRISARALWRHLPDINPEIESIRVRGSRWSKTFRI